VPAAAFFDWVARWLAGGALGLAVVGQVEARALDAADLPMRVSDRAHVALVRFPQDRKEGQQQGHDLDDDLKLARKLLGHCSVRFAQREARSQRAGS
jgi:hypothetical protein